jgi:sarcosine oxidase subunit gamma
MISAPQRIFPFSRGGAAAGTPLPTGTVVLTDLTDRPRFGVKGSGSSAWLAAQGLSLPAVNRIGMFRNVQVLRLGSEDFVLLAEHSAKELSRLVDSWNIETGPRGFASWREEGWAWMRLSGPALGEVMARLCAVDLRPTKFGETEIAQTRVGHIEAVIFRAQGGFDVLFDVTMVAYFARVVTAAATHRELSEEAERPCPSARR